MSNCNSTSCGHRSWHCGQSGWNHNCGCVLSDGTPACNPWAPWGVNSTNCGCGHCSTCGRNGGCGCTACGAISANAGCSICGNSPCTCNQCGTWWGQCGDCAGGNSGYLVPRYVSIGRAFQRRITQTLCVDDIPDCAEAPLTLTAVTVSGQATWADRRGPPDAAAGDGACLGASAGLLRALPHRTRHGRADHSPLRSLRTARSVARSALCSPLYPSGCTCDGERGWLLRRYAGSTGGGLPCAYAGYFRLTCKREDARCILPLCVYAAYSKVTVVLIGAWPSNSTESASGWLRPQYRS